MHAKDENPAAWQGPPLQCLPQVDLRGQPAGQVEGGGLDQRPLFHREPLAEDLDGRRHQPLHELAAVLARHLRLAEQQALLSQLSMLEGQGHRESHRW